MYGPSSDTSFIVCDIFTTDLRSESVVSLIILALVTPFIFMKVIPLVVEYVSLSLIHISEPTRQAEISYAVFCLKKNC